MSHVNTNSEIVSGHVFLFANYSVIVVVFACVCVRERARVCVRLSVFVHVRVHVCTRISECVRAFVWSECV